MLKKLTETINSLSKFDDPVKLFNYCKPEVYHTTTKENLDSIIKHGLSDFWFSIEAGDSLDFIVNKESCSDNLVCIIIPTDMLDLDKIDFTIDGGDGWSDDWGGTGIFNGIIDITNLKVYDWDNESYLTIKKELPMENIQLTETIEKHDTLNDKLYTEDNMLKDAVREKILDITDTFVEQLDEDGIKLLIKDIVLIGSNASYNYTKDSDVDIHIIADTSMLNCPDNLYPAIYSAYRSLFNKNFEIDFYGIPVELYVETEDIKTVSNGIYSVKNNEWLKEPVQMDIPDIDMEEFNKEFKIWEDKYKDLENKIKADTDNTEVSENNESVIKLLEDIYELRKTSLSKDGEYSLGNLIFKEMRNLGYLDRLKELKNELISKELSLETLKESMLRKNLENYRTQLNRVAGTQVILQDNGYFFIHNIRENDVSQIVNNLNNQPFVEYARQGAAGRYDFSHINPVKGPSRFYTITGKIKE